MEFQSIASLGKVNIVTDPDLLGQVARFLDLDYTGTDDGVRRLLSSSPILARLVRNESGGTLAAGAVCKWDTGSTYGPYKAVAGAAGAADAPAGVVDPWISAAVPDDEFFWLIYSGPCKFLFTTGTTLAKNDLLIAGASGRVTKATVGTSSPHFHCGRALEAVDTAIANDTLFRGYADFRF